MAGGGAWALVVCSGTLPLTAGGADEACIRKVLYPCFASLVASAQIHNFHSYLHCSDPGDPKEARQPQRPPPPSAPARVAAPALATLGSPGSGPADGCLIKGNIGAKGDHIYHLPGGRFYPGVKV